MVNAGFFWSSVLKLCEGLGDVVEHQEVEPAAFVVPIHVHANVVFVENSCKMFGMLPPNVLDSKVFNTESE
jgi:hypothetical protein